MTFAATLTKRVIIVPEDVGTMMKPKRKAHRRELWNPQSHGISFSSLSKYTVCRHRFWLSKIQDLEEVEGFRMPMEFGSLWHEAEEAHLEGKPWLPPVRKYRDSLRATYPTVDKEINRTFELVKLAFPLYIKRWKKDPNYRGHKFVLAEEAFNIPIRLPSGRTININGRFDGVYRVKKSIWLMENKTKGKIDEEGIANTFDVNLQTMIYQIILRLGVKDLRAGKEVPWATPGLVQAVRDGCKVQGTVYNVIRRPLSDQRAPRQRKGREVNKLDPKTKKPIKGKNGKPVKVRKGVESDRDFFKRVAVEMTKDLPHHFLRWKVRLPQAKVDDFFQRILGPLLDDLLDWWVWVSIDPENPWRTMDARDLKHPVNYARLPANGVPGGGIHSQTPWGIYNHMAEGFRGDFFDLLAKDDHGSVRKRRRVK